MQTVIVKRTGNARIRRAAIDGVALRWKAEDASDTERSVSVPKKLPAGEHVFTWFARGKKNQTYGYFFVSPSGVPCFVGPKTFGSAGFDSGVCRFVLS